MKEVFSAWHGRGGHGGSFESARVCPAAVAAWKMERSHIGKCGGFTLIEMLAVTAVCIILASLGASALRGALANGAKVREIQAARQLTSAYLVAATDRDGVFLPGYDRTVPMLELPDGSIVHSPPSNRYPFRLAEYLSHQLEGAILVNANKRQINTSSAYQVSLWPAFGINYLFVGGCVSSGGEMTIPDEVATRAAHGANVLLFASAAFTSGRRLIYGFNLLTPPRIHGPMWVTARWSRGAQPEKYGNLHARYGDKVICSFLDGSVRLLGVEELRDMRLWSMRAAEAQDAACSVPHHRPPGRR